MFFAEKRAVKIVFPLKTHLRCFRVID